jgi:hypothetical protein
MRFVSTASLVVIALCLAALAAVPPLREAVDEAVMPEHVHVDYLEEAQARGNDAEAWLGAIDYANPVETKVEQIEEACERAAKLLPDSPAPQLLFGVRGIVLSRETQSTPDPEKLKRAWARMEQAAALDPGNPALDYYRAYLALAQHRDEQAMGFLRAALAKKGWNLYQKDAAVAARDVALDQVDPLLASVMATCPMSNSWVQLTGLARTLVAMAEQAEASGDHKQAIFLRRSAMHLGQVMIRSGYSLIDALPGLIIWGASAELPIPQGKGLSDSARLEESVKLKEAGRELLAGYLRSHGENALADEVLSFGKSADRLLERIVEHNTREQKRIVQWSHLQSALARATRAMVVWLGLLILASIAGFAVTARRRQVAPVGGAWALAMLMLLGAAGAASFIVTGLSAWLLDAGLVLVLLGVLGAGAVHRKRHASDREWGPVGQYVGTLIMVALPLAALLCMTTVGLAGVVACETSAQIKANTQIIERGEIAYYGLRPQ